MSSKAILILMVLILFVASGCGAGTKEELYAEGMKLMDQANYSGAIVAFRNALEKDQNYTDARYQMAKAYIELGRFDQAEQELRKVQLQNPNHPGIALDMARIYMHTNRLDQADAEAGKHLQAQPLSAEALVILGEIQGRLGELDLARESYQQALRLQPDSVPAHLGMAKIHLFQNQPEQAKQELEIVLAGEPDNLEAFYVRVELLRGDRDPELLLETYEKITRINPQDVNAFYQQGLLLLDKDEIDKTEEIAKTMERKFPRRPEGFRLSGLKYFKELNYSEAIVSLQQANSILPTSDTNFYLGLSLHQMGELESALSQFRTILERNPDSIEARLMTAMILMQQHRLDLAQAEAEQIISRDQQNAMAHNILGSVLMAQGDHEQGMQALNRATQINPQLADAFFKQGIFQLGTGRGEEAALNFDAAIKLAPEQTTVRLLQYANLMQQGQMDEAYTTMEQGLSETAGDAVLLNNMAAVRFAQNKPEEGLGLLAKAKESNPEYVPAYFNTAAYYQARGELELALSEYQALLSHHPDSLRGLLSAAGISAALGKDNLADEYFAAARRTNQPLAFLASAEYRLRKGQPDQANDILDQGIAATDDHLALKEAKGRILMARKEYDQAIVLFEDIKAVQAESGIQLLVGAHLQKGDVQRAIEQCREMIALHPDSARGHLLLASIYETVHDLDQAEEHIQAAMQAEPDSTQAYFRLGNLQARRGEMDQAMETFEQALAVDPNFIPAIFARGNLLEAQNEIPQAMEQYQRILRINANYVPALNNLAYLALKGHGGSKEEALQMAARAFRQEQNNPGVLDTLGLALLKNDRAEEGRRILERAVELLPDHPSVRFHMAMAYKMTGEPEKALEQLNKALGNENFPELQEAREMKRELEGGSS